MSQFTKAVASEGTARHEYLASACSRIASHTHRCNRSSLAIDEFLKSIVLLRDERGIFANWLADVTDLAISGKRAHDARLVAAMQRHGLQQIVTFNKSDFTGFPNIAVLAPHEVV